MRLTPFQNTKVINKLNIILSKLRGKMEISKANFVMIHQPLVRYTVEYLISSFVL